MLMSANSTHSLIGKVNAILHGILITKIKKAQLEETCFCIALVLICVHLSIEDSTLPAHV